jgi:hypothetical protein
MGASGTDGEGLAIAKGMILHGIVDCPAGVTRRRTPRLTRRSQVLSSATGRSFGASARACGRDALSRHARRRALHHGLATVSDRGEDAMPDRPDPPPLAQSRPRDEPFGTSARGRVPPRPPQPSYGSARRTRSHPGPDRDPRPSRAHLGRSSPPGQGTAPGLVAERAVAAPPGAGRPLRRGWGFSCSPGCLWHGCLHPGNGVRHGAAVTDNEQGRSEGGEFPRGFQALCLVPGLVGSIAVRLPPPPGVTRAAVRGD